MDVTSRLVVVLALSILLAPFAGVGGAIAAADQAGLSPPGAPVLSLAQVTANPVTLSWTPGVGGAPSSYSVSAGTAAGASNLGVFPLGPATTISGSVPTNTAIFARVTATNSFGSAVSNEVSFTVPTPLAPGPPTLSATQVSANPVTLSWAPGGGGPPTSYTLAAGLAAGAANLGVFPMGVNTSVTAVAPVGVPVFVRVTAANAQGTATSSDVSFTVEPPPPPTPPIMNPASVAGSTVQLSWTSGGSGATHTILARYSSAGPVIQALPAGAVLGQTVTNVPPGTYIVSVLAQNASGTSPESNQIVVTVAEVSAATNWNVTQRFVSVAGPDNCWVREQRQRLTGVVFADLPMAVTRSNGVISLESAYFQVNYRGTYTGTTLTASGVGPLIGGGRPCQDGSSFIQMAGASALSGSFSADDQGATLTEVNAYRLTTGELVTYTWAWQATRRP